MEVHFTPEQEARLSEIASHAGMDTERLVKDTVVRLLEQDARFRTVVRKGIAHADRGELIEEEEMDARIERSSTLDANPLDARGSRRLARHLRLP
jgi:predicted transcriptional regulator